VKTVTKIENDIQFLVLALLLAIGVALDSVIVGDCFVEFNDRV